MEAKLIKEGSFGYKIKFYNDDDMAACVLGLLSLKNCQAIELGYDLDELVKSTVNQNIKRSMEDLRLRPEYTKYAKAGFQKALEILGDKKFSEEDMIREILIWDNHINIHEEDKGCIREISQRVKSLQQTEWDVEIMMDMILVGQCDCPCHSEEATIMHFMACCHPKMVESPKLDADGCLILKRK